MIVRINLLSGAGQKQKSSRQINFFVILALVIGSSILVAGGVTLYFSMTVSNLRTEVEANKKTFVGLQKKSEEIQKYEKLIADVKKKNELIDGLRKNQSVPVRLMDEVSALIPEKVWLTQMSYKGNKTEIEGYAFSNIDIVTYVENLKRRSDLSEVFLQESRQVEYEKQMIYKFNLSFKVKT